VTEEQRAQGIKHLTEKAPEILITEEVQSEMAMTGALKKSHVIPKDEVPKTTSVLKIANPKTSMANS
jgi:hypothetical protein